MKSFYTSTLFFSFYKTRAVCQSFYDRTIMLSSMLTILQDLNDYYGAQCIGIYNYLNYIELAVYPTLVIKPPI